MAALLLASLGVLAAAHRVPWGSGALSAQCPVTYTSPGYQRSRLTCTQLSSTVWPPVPISPPAITCVCLLAMCSPFPLSALSAYLTCTAHHLAALPSAGRQELSIVPAFTVSCCPLLELGGLLLRRHASVLTISCRPVPRPRIPLRSRQSATSTGVRYLRYIPSSSFPCGKSHRPCLPSSACLFLPFRPHGNLGLTSSFRPHVELWRESIR